MPSATTTRSPAPTCEIFILAGGLSTRMGRDKSHIRLGGRTLLQHVRDAAGPLELRVRVIRRDSVPRCGPLGGIYTGLKRSRADVVMFLACDMPFVSTALLKKMLKQFHRTASSPPALFALANDRAGFPCVLQRATALPVVARQIAKSGLSLQSLAKALRAQTIRPPRAARQLRNINFPAELKEAVRDNLRPVRQVAR